jgi:hypothetical protein
MPILHGTPQTVINTATDIANGNFSGAPAAEFNNTNDGAVPNAPYATAMIELPDWGAAPTALATVDLFMVKKNTDSGDDDTDAPSGSSQGGAQYCGSFYLAAADALQRRTIVIDIMGVIGADFYIRNNSGQNLNNDGGTNCVLKITPFDFVAA